MAERDIDELADVDDLSLQSILHTKNRTDRTDRKVTIQQVADILPDFTATIDPPDGSSFSSDNDKVVFSDASDDNTLKKLPLSTILSSIDIPVLDGDETEQNSHFDIGGLEIRWGRVFNSTNQFQSFNFERPFSNACHIVMITPEGSNIGIPMGIEVFNTVSFGVNRDGGGNRFIHYLALGY